MLLLAGVMDGLRLQFPPPGPIPERLRDDVVAVELSMIQARHGEQHACKKLKG